MNASRLLVQILAAAFAFSTLDASGADDGKQVVKGAVSEKKAARNEKRPAVAKSAPRTWRRTADQPCDSSACRPFRFAWSPVAPGA